MAGLRRRRSRGRRSFKIHKPEWRDPFPGIPGTEPEKRIFEVLVRKGIYFIFQGNLPEFEKGLFVTLSRPWFKPDFILPEYRIIIDPFSPFHHSLPEAQKRDAEKYAIYTAKVPGHPNIFNYGYYFPWAVAPGVFVFDQKGAPKIRGGAQDIIDAIPELRQPPKHKLTDPRDIRAKRHPGYRLGPNLGLGANSVAAANRKRTRPPKLTLSAGTRRRKRTRGL